MELGANYHLTKHPPALAHVRAAQLTEVKLSKRRILSVTIHRDLDDSPDLSWIGEYSNHPGPDDRTIDRQERGDMGHGEFRYFVAAMSPADTGNAESVECDYRRMEDYSNGGWHMTRVYATADVQFLGDVVQTLRSGGLWGIESDSGDYFKDVEQDELAVLRSELRAAGFSDKAIAAAFAEVEHVEG